MQNYNLNLFRHRKFSRDQHCGAEHKGGRWRNLCWFYYEGVCFLLKYGWPYNFCNLLIHCDYSGAVAQDGRIEPGDMILEVNGISFENMSNDDAVRTLREAVQRPG